MAFLHLDTRLVAPHIGLLTCHLLHPNLLVVRAALRVLTRPALVTADQVRTATLEHEGRLKLRPRP